MSHWIPRSVARAWALEVLRMRNPWPAECPKIAPNIHGWTTHEEKMLRLCPAAEVVVEVGAWLGKGTNALLRVYPEATIISIDHWRGSVEHQPGQPHYHEDLPILWDRWCRNFWPDRHRIIPMRKASWIALEELALHDRARFPAHRAVPLADVVYIDASHLFEDVVADVCAAAALSPALLCGDDYEVVKEPNDVRRAVHHVADQRGWTVRNEGRFWWYET